MSGGELEIKPLCDHLNSHSDSEKSSVYYHSECRWPLGNKVNIERMPKSKTSRSDSPVASSSLRKRGRPSASGDTPRPKRTKSVTKAQICMFSSCSFYPTYDIKQNTVNDQVKTCLSELMDAGNVSALEKWYHRTCLRSAQRTINKVRDTQLIRSICDDELYPSKQLTGNDVTVNMAEINKEYLSLLKWHQVCLTESQN